MAALNIRPMSVTKSGRVQTQYLVKQEGRTKRIATQVIKVGDHVAGIFHQNLDGDKQFHSVMQLRITQEHADPQGKTHAITTTLSFIKMKRGEAKVKYRKATAYAKTIKDVHTRKHHMAITCVIEGGKKTNQVHFFTQQQTIDKDDYAKRFVQAIITAKEEPLPTL
eukprot:CAMPEP_0117418746 /NCGR_PEP_ID=MMETSP0758-20121206/460_1 /TAXON_ID=63605 /ORGANISM="Percolomonas cosmopolitus, Strain AE-1 (ATCC 50343)" /LENGTH=165 /DNA_ID=CAMNT_0005199423 /DNA_START=652 /DNA_END=1146 /DNA_ORIENTATION=+